MKPLPLNIPSLQTGPSSPFSPSPVAVAPCIGERLHQQPPWRHLHNHFNDSVVASLYGVGDCHLAPFEPAGQELPDSPQLQEQPKPSIFFSFFFMFFFYFLFLFFFIFLFVMNFVIHWNETAMGLHVFPIPIPPPTSLSTRSP